MKKFTCQYSIVRFLPYAETGEFANIGVVLCCPELGFLDGIMAKPQQTKRVSGFFENLDRNIYGRAIKHFEQDLQRVKGVLREHPDLARHLFEEIIRPRNSLLAFSNRGAVRNAHPAEALTTLFAQQVERNFATREYHKDLEKSVRSELKKLGMNEIFKDGKLGDDSLYLKIPFQAKVGDENALAIKPIDLDKANSNEVFDIGGKLVDKIRRLRNHNILDGELLVVTSFPRERSHRVRSAASEILTDLRSIDVSVVENASSDEFAEKVVSLADFSILRH